MSRKDVVVLNSHGVGQYAYTDHMPKWGETLSVKNWYVAEDGGKGTNVAVALARLGSGKPVRTLPICIGQMKCQLVPA